MPSNSNICNNLLNNDTQFAINIHYNVQILLNTYLLGSSVAQ